MVFLAKKKSRLRASSRMAVRVIPLMLLVASGLGRGVRAESTVPESPHWAFQLLVRPAVPNVQRSNWVQTSVDAFVLSKLEAHDLAPSPEAPRQTLLRRLWANLVGLPPSREVVDDFLRDTAPGAYQRLVERLLNSPHYGERWGRHWLDVARFAESTGFVENHNQPHFWRYRDWVVQSFNDDKPYDLFITQQIAGDELEPYADENIVATGFLAAARLSSEELSCVRQENDMYVDIVNATSSSFLGLTMACAQCHDHMFDPLSQRDYFRLRAFFIRGYPGNVVLGGEKVPEAVHESAAHFHATNLKIRQRVLEEGVREGSADLQRLWATSPTERTPEEEAKLRVQRAALNIRIAGCNAFRIKEDERQALDAAKAAIDKFTPQLTQTWAFYSPVTSPHRLSTLLMAGNFPLIHDRDELGSRRAYLHRRGDPYQPEELVTPGFPEILSHSDPPHNPGADCKRERTRTDLAKWLTSRDSVASSLVARVWVNRIWLHHFGRGLVATPGNFGIRGARPTHPLLLEHLAAELIDCGWSTKHIQRLIVNSNTYKQRAAGIDEARARSRIDASHRLYGRWPIRRLEAEVIRDMMLAVSGKLNPSIGGPSIPHDVTSTRRSLYLFQKRDVPHEMPALFDGPIAMSASCPQRHVSTSALQPLFLLNSPKTAAWANAFADVLFAEAPHNLERQVELAFKTALAREPNELERAESMQYLRATLNEPDDIEDRTSRIVKIDFPEDGQEPPAPGAARPSIVATQPSQQGQYVLHLNGYSGHEPDPAKATVTYYFSRPSTVAELELIVHKNGMTRVEGFVGNSVHNLEPIGEATNPVAGRGKQFPEELGVYLFAFDEAKCRPGRVFRFVVKETVKQDGYANYQAYPRDLEQRRIPPTTDVVPDAPRPMSPLAGFCQAMMNLNEFIYVP